MTKKLILIGGGGHCKTVIDVAESAGHHIMGILGKPEEVGRQVLGYNVIGVDNDIPLYADKAEFIITVGFIKNPALRIRLYNKVLEAGGRLATLVASTAYVSKYAVLGKGTVVMHQAFVNAGAMIGDNVILNTFSNIEHDACIGNQCHISTGTMVNGDCNVGNNVFVGSQSVLSNGIRICDDVIVGAGSFVRKPIHVKGLYSGNPATLKIRL
ncbi:acetyltransferase [Bacteroides uniformis]|jgi:sugar O-acyltransferase, sialic acid O-acetyltransferase neuD family|uniref:acetyltransferase n=1 Tax=Bacteroides uniformis TaxID=820 RepID=UPI000E4DCE35|nr:acetyltransferase [Bacteroides uniformis]MDC1810140.1 acetyltransferase [Bacteroides uniformis]RHI06981.1 acetyltransferase [Bacteroides uniformis]